MDEWKHIAELNHEGHLRINKRLVKKDGWYRITITWDEPNWWQKLKRKVERR